MTLTRAGSEPASKWLDTSITPTGRALEQQPESVGSFVRPYRLFSGNEAKTRQALLHSEDIGKREAVKLVDDEGPDMSVLPGKMATKEAIAEEKLRASVIDLVNRFFAEGHSRQAGRVSKISSDTRNSAIALFSSLPSGSAFPKLSPDGDGGLMMVWESGATTALAILDGSTIHVVKAPATAQAKYFDDIPYDRKRIPPALLQAIPVR